MISQQKIYEKVLEVLNNFSPYSKRDKICVDMLREGYWLVNYRSHKKAGGFLGLGGSNIAMARFDIDLLGKNSMIEDLIIHPKYQGRGLGKELVGMIKSVCKELGLEGISIKKNDNHDFWRKMGFTGDSIKLKSK